MKGEKVVKRFKEKKVSLISLVSLRFYRNFR